MEIEREIAVWNLTPIIKKKIKKKLKEKKITMGGKKGPKRAMV